MKPYVEMAEIGVTLRFSAGPLCSCKITPGDFFESKGSLQALPLLPRPHIKKGPFGEGGEGLY